MCKRTGRKRPGKLVPASVYEMRVAWDPAAVGGEVGKCTCVVK